MSTLQSSQLNQLATRIRIEHEAAFGAAREALAHAKRAGELLIAAKKQTKHGEWLPWLSANFNFTPRTAQSYMTVASRWEELQSKSETVSHLTFREALALLSPPREFQPHEICLIFPAMTDPEFEGLKQSIQTVGLLEKITLYEGQILDGKERYRACLAVGVEPEFEEFTGDDALAFVLSKNLYRQHFTLSQRAAIQAEFEAAHVC